MRRGTICVFQFRVTITMRASLWYNLATVASQSCEARKYILGGIRRALSSAG